MLDSDRIERYLNSSEAEKSVKSNTFALQKSMLKSLSAYEQKIKKPVEYFTKEDFVNLFNENRWVMSYTIFTEKKCRIVSYLEWSAINYRDILPGAGLEVIKSLNNSDVDSDRYISYFYFKDESDLLVFMEEHFGPDDYIRAKAITLLSWLGETYQTISELKWFDILKYKSLLSSEAYRILERCAFSLKDTSYKNGNPCVYNLANTDYLIKPWKKNGTANNTSPDTVKSFIRRVNEYLEESNSKCIKPRALYENYLFTQLYAYESSSGRYASFARQSTIKDFIVSNQADTSIGIRGFVERYIQWRKYYYNV